MASRDFYSPRPQADIVREPFDSAEEAWFWFVQAQQARNDGARFTLGAGAIPRPCEPCDILKIVDRLYRNRRLVMDHLLVLRHYGVRMLPPDPRRSKEARAHGLWVEALGRIGDVLEGKGIVRKTGFFHDPALYENGAVSWT